MVDKYNANLLLNNLPSTSATRYGPCPSRERENHYLYPWNSWKQDSIIDTTGREGSPPGTDPSTLQLSLASIKNR